MADVMGTSFYGNQIVVHMSDGTQFMTFPTNTNYWIRSGEDPTPPDPDPAQVIDNLLPGHTITNPGGTIAAAWQWHIDNNASGAGGVDLNYAYGTPFKAPAAGVVSHFDVSGVGMVVKLVLDDPAPRTSAQLANRDAAGPMRAIWFLHCASAVDGPAEQGKTIGTSGNGYGQYGAHLHVHGQINTDNNSTYPNRCNFWGFLS